MPAKPRVEIEGLKDIQKRLRDLDPELAKELKVINLRVAEMVADLASSKVPKDSGAARASVKAKGEQRYAKIYAGGKKAPYYPWLDFGGGIPNTRNRGSNPPRVSRPFIREGRYIYPTVGKERDAIIRLYVVALGKLLDKADL